MGSRDRGNDRNRNRSNKPRETRKSGEPEPSGTAGERPGDFASQVDDVTRFERVARPRSNSGAARSQRPPSAPTRPRFVFPDPFEPLYCRAKACPEKELLRLARGEPRPSERIDLHGFDRARAHAQLNRSLVSAALRNIECVLIIHGRGLGSGDGEAILKQALPGWLTTSPCAKTVRAFAPARQRDGGQGASYVLVRASD